MASELNLASAILEASSAADQRNASHSDFDQLKGQFLASLNHELRTPLSGVVGMTDLLLETRLDAEQFEYVAAVRECATQLLETLNSVLEYSALAAGNGRLEDCEFPLAAMVASVLEEFRPRATAKNIKLVQELPDAFPELVEGDGRYVRQMLHHLLRNAIKFTNHGEVRVASRLEQGSSPGRPLLRISVTDTGIGIPRAKLRLIFESFQQLDNGLARNYAGLGLGLALARKIVSMMRGEIEVSSEPGLGSTFTVRFPVRIADAQPGPQLVAPVPLRARQPRVLVVEDNKIAQQVVGRILRKANYDVEFADGGGDGVERAAREKYDLILMDLQMPGMDGFAATRGIRAVPGRDKVPIVALTANSTDEDRVACRQCGMQGFLSKPVHREELLACLQTLLAER